MSPIEVRNEFEVWVLTLSTNFTGNTIKIGEDGRYTYPLIQALYQQFCTIKSNEAQIKQLQNLVWSV